MMTTNQFTPGQALTWLYTPRGGYGYVYPVNAEVVRQAGKRVIIRVAKKSGERVERAVNPENLRERKG